MTSEGLGEMFEGDYADTCSGKFPLMSMGGRAEGLACADSAARTPLGVTGQFECLFICLEIGNMVSTTVQHYYVTYISYKRETNILNQDHCRPHIHVFVYIV